MNTPYTLNESSDDKKKIKLGLFCNDRDKAERFQFYVLSAASKS